MSHKDACRYMWTHVDTCVSLMSHKDACRFMSHKDTCSLCLSNVSQGNMWKLSLSQFGRRAAPDLEGVLLECQWGECFLGRVFTGESVSWGECFLGRVFPGESVYWRECF